MKINLLPAALACAFALPAMAQSSVPEAPHQHAHAMSTPTIDVPADAQAAVAVVDGFSKALAGTDFKTVETALDPAVIILESGGAERSREEYLGHHAFADAAFLGGAHVALKRRTARVDGDTAWVASENELHATEDGKPMTLLSTETMVLHKTADGWRIVHIHWSSRPKKEA
jgi:ketosteroid isomerase-like protein